MLDKAPSFASVARKIGDRRLEKALQKLASNVETDIHNAKFVPVRAEVRDDLKQLKAETKRFENALNRVSQRLVDLPTTAIECLPLARQTIHEIIALCDGALSVTSAKGGATKKPGRIICALIVIEAWAFVRGDPPGANNEPVQEICDAYWCACGQEAIGSGDPSNWRRSVTEALSADHGAMRQMRRYIYDEIRRCTE